MGGKSGKAEVNEYSMAMHLGVCHEVDAFTRIVIGEKVAWSGLQTTTGDVTINLPQLFGGPKKEGGVGGVVRFLLGLPNQVLPDGLATRLGRSSGATCPGFRGIASLFFTGLVGAAQPGFYWTANNPYLKSLWVGVRRAPKGLNPAYAMIPRGSGTLAPIDLSSEFPVLTVGNPGYPTPVSFYPKTLTLGPYGTAAEIVSGNPNGSGNCRPDDFFYFNGVKYGAASPAATTWPAGTVLHSLAAGQTVSVQIENTINSFSGVSGSLHVRFTGSDELDANPAHIIYECLTNPTWGMGAPPAAIDTAAFEAVGETLYAEGLGLSILWSRQDTIENFISEIVDHIQAMVFINPRTGLFTITLVRGGYDVASLRTITPDNADLGNFQRKAWGEIVNEIVVTWTNPETEQDETVTAQDLGAIAAQNGAIISGSRNYYGVRSAPIAIGLAARDLVAASAPMATCDALLDRLGWDLLPGEVVKVNWPEHGLVNVVMRVGPVDYGKPGEAVISAPLIEDIFGLAASQYSTPPATSWVSDDTAPTTMDHARIITVPAFLATNYLAGAGDASSFAHPEVLSGVLASDAEAHSYNLYGPSVQLDGTTVQEQQSTNSVLGHGTLVAALPLAASSAGVSFAGLIGRVSPAQNIFVVIGDDADSEAEMEIALITASPGGGVYTLARGLLDTVPRAWAAGSTVWLLDRDNTISDLDAKSDGETLTYRLLSRTFAGVLDYGAAAPLVGTLSGRPHYPNRPANVIAHGGAWSSSAAPIDAVERADPWVSVSWANRNRLLEDSQVLLWDDATVPPEAGQTATVEVRSASGTLLATHAALAGTSFDVPDASFVGEGLVELRILGERDGFDSLQYFAHWVLVLPPRRTETDDTRFTEAGERRFMED